MINKSSKSNLCYIDSDLIVIRLSPISATGRVPSAVSGGLRIGPAALPRRARKCPSVSWERIQNDFSSGMLRAGSMPLFWPGAFPENAALLHIFACL